MGDELMQVVTFTNAKGQQVTFGYTPPFILSSIEGLGDLTANTQSQKAPYQDGETYIDSYMNTRPIPIRFMILSTNISEKRSHLSSVFNPKLGEGTLRYENDNGAWEIDCVADGVPFFPSGNARGPQHQEGRVDLISHQPYWKSIETKSEPLSAVIGLFQFPISFPMTFGKRGDYTNVLNDGHVPCPIEIEFLGPVDRPIIENETTGKFIQINRFIDDGQRLYINTAFGNKRVEIVHADGTRENAYHYIDIFESELFWLDVGINRIRYSAVEGVSNATVTVTHRNYYVGV